MRTSHLIIPLQGVELLPDFSKVSFPNMHPLALPLLLPQSHHADLTFLSTLLQLNPLSRSSAKQALSNRYFYVAPLPCVVSSSLLLPTNSEGHELKEEKPISSLKQFQTQVIDPVLARHAALQNIDYG
jgi:serine/threonine protein kinase